jgi:uncharacterized repeat protein (TIGR01451 family)
MTLIAAAMVACLLHGPRGDGRGWSVAVALANPSGPADIAVSQTVDNSNPGVGGSVTFTITVRNNGPGDATRVAVTDRLPDGVSVPARQASAGIYDPTTGVWTIGALARGASATLQLTVTVNQTGPLVNTATKTAEDQPDPTRGDDSATVRIVGQSADITVTNSVDEARPNLGDQVTFTVTATNRGPTDATGVRVTDLLPLGLAYADDNPSQGSYDGISGIWSVGALAAGASATLDLTALVQRTGRLVDIAGGAVADQFNPSSGNSAPVTVNGQAADVSVVEIVDNPKPAVGAHVRLTVTAANSGPSDATGVVVNARLPAGLTLVSASSLSPYDPATGTWKLGTLATGTAASLTLVATVAQAGTIVASAGKTAEDQTDPSGGNDVGSVVVAGQLADVVLAVAVDDPNPGVGLPVTVTLKAVNKGPSDATGVAVTCVLPAGLLLLSTAPTTGAYDPATGIWRVGSLANGSNATLSLQAAVTRALPLTVTARRTGDDQAGPALGDDSASVKLSGQEADVAVSETVDHPATRVGDRVAFTVTATNRGPSDATGLVIADRLPPGLKLNAARPSTGTYNPETGVWMLGRLVSGASAGLTLQATVLAAGPLISVARKAAEGQADPTADDDTASAMVVGEAADVALAMKVDNSRPNVGAPVTFTVTATNNGPQDATGVTVRDLLPSGLTLISATSSSGAYSPVSGDWEVGTLAVGTSASLTITAVTTRAGPIVNEAKKTTEDQADQVPTNDSASVTVSGQAAHIAVASSVDDPKPGVGGTVTLYVSASNRGPSDATGVRLSVALPAGLSYLSSSASTGHYDAVDGMWVVGDLASQTSASLSLRAGVASFGPLVATVRALGQDQPDPAGPSAPDHTASTSVSSQLAHVVLTSAADNQRPSVGSQVTLVVTASNRGPSDATGITVSDLLPPGLILLSASPSAGTARSSLGPDGPPRGAGGGGQLSATWTLPRLASGASATLALKARVARPGALTSVARKTHQDQPDPSPADGSTEATVEGQQADVTLTQTVDNSRPGAGQVVTFTITAVNSGPGEATAVEIADPLPAGLRYMSTAATAGSYDPRTGTWSIATLPVGTKATLYMTAAPTRAGPITNTAHKTGQAEFDPTAGDDAASSTLVGQSAGVEVMQSVDDPRPGLGASVTLSVTAANRGPDAATGLRLNEALPPGLDYASSQASQGAYDPATETWLVGGLAPGTSATLRLTATVTRAGSLTIKAARATLDQFDPGSGPASAVVTLAGQSADVVVTNAVGDAEPSVGTIATFTVTATNRGPSDATGVVIADPLPAGLALVAASPAGAYDTSTGTWRLGRLAGGATSTLTLRARVTQPGPLVTTARRVYQDQAAPPSQAATAVASLTGREADIQMGVSVDRPRVKVGEDAILTVTATNAGPSDADVVAVSDRLPPGLTLGDVSASAGTYDSATGNWQVGRLARGARANLVFHVRVNVAGPITNRAALTASDPADTTPDDDSASTVVVGEAADIGVTLTVDNPQPSLGGLAVFTITARNNGPDNATGVQVADRLPAGMAFVSDQASQGTYDPETGAWTVGALGRSESATLRLTVAVTQTGPLVNQAVRSSGDQADPDPTNDVATARIAAQAADVSVVMVADQPTPAVGAAVRLTVTATNHGPGAATGVRLAGRLPGGLTLVSGTPSSGVFDHNQAVWSIGALPAGTSATLALTARVIRAGKIEVTFSKSAQDQPDPTSLDDTALVVVNGQQADVALNETVDDPRPSVGRNAILTVTAANLGPDEATGVVVTPSLPAGLELVSTTASSGSYDRAAGEWRLDALAPGSRATLALTVTVTRPGPLAASAVVRAEDQTDPTPSDDSATVSLSGQAADISVSEAADNPRPDVGGRVGFTVTVRNAGPSAARGVVVTDVLTPGLTYAEHTSSRGVYSASSGNWTVGALAAGESATLRLTVDVTRPGLLTSTVRRTASDVADTNPANDIAVATVTGQEAAVSVAVAASSDQVAVGGQVLLRVNAQNHGPSDASGVRVIDQLPTGMTFVSASPSVGIYDPVSGDWDVGGLPVGATATLAITARVTRAGDIIDSASRSHIDQPDANPTGERASITVTGESADVALAIAADTTNPNLGDRVAVTVTAVNYGPSQATGLKVGDQLPAGLALVSVTTSAGVYDPRTGTWSLAGLADGASATLSLVATVTRTGPLVDVARKVAEDQADPTSADDAVSITLTGQAADIALSQTVDNPAPNLNGRATITVTVTDLGPSTASGVRVSDSPAPGLAYAASQASQGAYDPRTGVWSVGDLAVGGSASLRLGVTVTQPGPISNEAWASSSQPDPSLANNSAVLTIASPRADVSITRTVDNPEPRLGSMITFTTTAFNAGPESATGVRVTGALPAGLTFVSASAGQGDYDRATGVWTVGSLASGSMATLTVQAWMDLPGPFVSTSRESQDQPNLHPNPIATVSVSSG